MSKLKRLVVFTVLPFVAVTWVVGWFVSLTGTKKVNLKIKDSQSTKLLKIK
jgi:hypothetical protein